MINLFGRVFSRLCRPFLSFLFPRASFSLLSLSMPRGGPSSPARGFGVVLLAPPRGDNDICSQQTRPLGSQYTKNTFAAQLAIQPQTHFWCI